MEKTHWTQLLVKKNGSNELITDEKERILIIRLFGMTGYCNGMQIQLPSGNRAWVQDVSWKNPDFPWHPDDEKKKA